MKSNDEVLALIYKINGDIDFVVDGQQIVTILKKQNHWIQRMFRKIKVNIPEYKRVTLDEYASYVFLQIDGIKTVEAIGQKLEEKYGEASHPLYERLLLFLNHIDVNEHYIGTINH